MQEGVNQMPLGFAPLLPRRSPPPAISPHSPEKRGGTNAMCAQVTKKSPMPVMCCVADVTTWLEFEKRSQFAGGEW